jgi:hypothetical protein
MLRLPHAAPRSRSGARQGIITDSTDPTSFQMGSKTLANHRANLKAALRWLSGETGLPTRGAPLSSAWARLRDAITDKGLRARLYGLMRFASAQGIPPDEVTEEHVLAYLRYRAETTALAAGLAAHRSIARSGTAALMTLRPGPGSALWSRASPALSKGQPGRASRKAYSETWRLTLPPSPAHAAPARASG